jgi:hypothetical protein
MFWRRYNENGWQKAKKRRFCGTRYAEVAVLRNEAKLDFVLSSLKKRTHQNICDELG